MFDVMRSFVDQNRRAKRKGATYIKALYRATLAGARVLGLSKRCGNFKPGKDGTFLVVKMPAGMNPSSAESALAGLIEPHIHHRERYDGLVSKVYLRGKQAVP
jgi:guanine deaminase